MMGRLSLQALGPFRVILGGLPVTGPASDMVRALLGYLAAQAHRP